MNAELEKPLAEEDRPPDPRVAGAAMGQAVRIAEAASGLAILVTAGVVAGAGALVYGLAERAAPYYVPAWTAILVSIGIVYWAVFFVVKRTRGRAGLPVVEPRRPTAPRIALLGISAVIYLAVLSGAVILLGLRLPYHVMLIGTFGILFGAMWLVHGIRAREWEDVAVGLALCGLSVFAVVRKELPPEAWLVLAAVLFGVSGGVKHIRWRRWARTHEGGANRAPAQEAQS